MRLTVLGCSGSYPGAGQPCSGYLVDDGDTRIWLDAGSGTLANLQRHLDVGQLDAIVLSHEHPDHWNDLEGFRVMLQFVLYRHQFPVYAPAGLKEHVYGDAHPWVEWHDVADGDTVGIGGLDLSFSRTDHGPETLGVRVDSRAGGTSLGYSADTGPGWSLEALGPGLDWALCEATVPVALEGMLQHLSARQAGASAKAAGAAHLILTHRWPSLDGEQSRRDGEDGFGAPVELAEVGRSWDL